MAHTARRYAVVTLTDGAEVCTTEKTPLRPLSSLQLPPPFPPSSHLSSSSSSRVSFFSFTSSATRRPAMFTTPTERFEPTLAGLPDKIKREIVDFLDEVSFYEDDEDWESDDGDEGGEGMAVDASGDTTMDGEGDGDNVAEDEAQLLELLALMDPANQRMTTLSALSRVSREWNAVVSPVFWEVRSLSSPCFLSFPLVSPPSPRQS